MLAAGPMCVGDLAAQLPVTRPAVSQHLKVLKDAGLVGEEAVGTRRIYRLDADGAAALREQLDLIRVPTNLGPAITSLLVPVWLRWLWRLVPGAGRDNSGTPLNVH